MKALKVVLSEHNDQFDTDGRLAVLHSGINYCLFFFGLFFSLYLTTVPGLNEK